MNVKKDKKTVLILLIVFAVIVLAYLARALYFGYTGPVQTELLYPSIYHKNVIVQGFAVRDESRYKNGKNISILTMQSNKVYIPTVSDSASVAVGDSIAVCFTSQEQAKLYDKLQSIEAEIDNLEQLQSLVNSSLINVTALNDDISTAINRYVNHAESGNYAGFAKTQSSLVAKITAKQRASGGNLKVADRIDKYVQKKVQLEKKIQKKTYVTSPYAGYFVSEIDGYESAYDYTELENGKITTSQINDLFHTQPSVPENTIGKIIGQHVWYFVCNMSLTDASMLKNGHRVTVDFPKENLFEIPMKVHAISERSGDQVAVIFQCTLLNDALSKLRNETAEITVNTYEGYRISNDLLVKNEDGLTGVYVLAGKRVQFKPIRILFHGDGYVIAAAAIYYLDNGEIDKEQTPALDPLETYDQLIVKGKNLYDGKVIS